ncbi:hypothetical protein Tco_1148144 [Tanacetum coccineum]
MWSSTRTVSPTPSSAIVQFPISDNFRIKGTHMQMIRDNQFDGRIQSDPHRHVADFLKISSLFQYVENQDEAVMLRTFPFSLSGESKTWLNELNEWKLILRVELMREAFISQYFSPVQFKRLLNEIHSFHQLAHETLENSKSAPKQLFPPVEATSIPITHVDGEIGRSHNTKINSEFLIIRKELKDMQDGFRENHALDDYLKDDTPMCEPNEANYVQRYHGGYHDHEPINSYSYPNHNPNHHYPYPRNQMPRPSRYFKFTETSTKEMMREWMASQMKANERMKNQVAELENQVNQGLRNHQAIIQNLERQFEFLLPTKTLPPATNTKPRHEIVYNIPSIRNNNDKGDVKFIEVDETQPVPTMPNLNLIEANSPIVSPFSKDCTMHIPYTDAKTFADVVLLNHVGEKELKSIVGDGIGVLTQKKIKKNNMGLSKEPAMKWNMERKIDEWENYQNLSSKQTDRTGPLPPHAHTEQVNVVFTESGKSDDFPEIQIDQPSSIIVNNKIKKDKLIKTSKEGYHVV